MKLMLLVALIPSVTLGYLGQTKEQIAASYGEGAESREGEARIYSTKGFVVEVVYSEAKSICEIYSKAGGLEPAVIERLLAANSSSNAWTSMSVGEWVSKNGEMKAAMKEGSLVVILTQLPKSFPSLVENGLPPIPGTTEDTMYSAWSVGSKASIANSAEAPTLPPKATKLVATFKGHGERNFEPYSIGKQGYRIEWSWKSKSIAPFLYIHIHDQRDNDFKETIHSDSPGAGSSYVNLMGPHYLKVAVSSESSYEIRVYAQ